MRPSPSMLTCTSSGLCVSVSSTPSVAVDYSLLGGSSLAAVVREEGDVAPGEPAGE